MKKKTTMRIGRLRKGIFSKANENSNPAEEARQAVSGWLY